MNELNITLMVLIAAAKDRRFCVYAEAEPSSAADRPAPPPLTLELAQAFGVAVQCAAHGTRHRPGNAGQPGRHDGRAPLTWARSSAASMHRPWRSSSRDRQQRALEVQHSSARWPKRKTDFRLPRREAAPRRRIDGAPVQRLRRFGLVGSDQIEVVCSSSSPSIRRASRPLQGTMDRQGSRTHKGVRPRWSFSTLGADVVRASRLQAGSRVRFSLSPLSLGTSLTF